MRARSSPHLSAPFPPPRQLPHGRSLADFPDLSEAELRLLRSCRDGTVALASKACPRKETARNRVRADFVRFLALGGDECCPVHEHGVRLHGAWLVGRLDLRASIVARPLALVSCRIEAADFTQATLHALQLNGSRLETGLSAQLLQCSGGVFLGQGLRAKGLVDLFQARMATLSCTGGRFSNPKGVALRCDGMSVSSSVFMADGFHATGAVRMMTASIGALDCSNGRFDNPGRMALALDRLIVVGSLVLARGFRAAGEVRMLGAKIGATIRCGGGRFDNPGSEALSMDRATVGGSVFLNDGFHATGKVRLPGAKIGSNLDCNSGRFDHPEGVALSADRANIEGSVHLNQGCAATGAIHFRAAAIGANLDCRGARLDGAGKAALAADGVKVKGSAFLSHDFHSTGEVRLLDAEIGGLLQCAGGKFENPEKDALVLDRASITGSVSLAGRFRATGNVRLLDAKVGSGLSCSGRFDGGTAKAFSCDGAQITGNVALKGQFRGTVRMVGTKILGQLTCSAGRFENPDGVALLFDNLKVDGSFFFRRVAQLTGGVDLTGATVGALCDDLDSWKGAQRRLILDGFTYQRLASHAPVDAESRLRWLGWQRPERLGAERFAPQPWDQLAATLRKMGHFEEARRIDIARHYRMRAAGRPVGGSSAWDWVYGALVDYGYRPQKVMAAVFVVWLACAFAYWPAANPEHFGLTTHHLAPTRTEPDYGCLRAAERAPSPPACAQKLPRYEDLSLLAYSAEVLIPVISLGHKGEWKPVVSAPDGRTLPWGWVLRLVYSFEILFGWLASLLLVAAVGNLIKKE